MAQNTRYLIAITLGATLVTGCASSGSGGVSPGSTGEPEKVFTPAWFDEASNALNDSHYYGYGQAVTPGLTSSRNQAGLQARAQLAQRYEQTVEQLVQTGAQVRNGDEHRLMEEAARSVSRTTLSDVETDRIERFRLEDDRIQTFVRVRVTKDAVEENARAVLEEMDERLAADAGEDAQ